jgi:hypothetical protein
MSGQSTDPDREVTETSEHYEVARTDDGWGIWDRRDPGRPLAMYPTGDRGFESAYEHFTRLNRAERGLVVRRGLEAACFWAAAVAGAVWVVSTAIFQVRLNLIEDPFQSQRAYESLQWMSSLSEIAYPIFLVAFGLNVLLRLESRRQLAGREQIIRGRGV